MAIKLNHKNSSVKPFVEPEEIKVEVKAEVEDKVEVIVDKEDKTEEE